MKRHHYFLTIISSYRTGHFYCVKTGHCRLSYYTFVRTRLAVHAVAPKLG